MIVPMKTAWLYASGLLSAQHATDSAHAPTAASLIRQRSYGINPQAFAVENRLALRQRIVIGAACYGINPQAFAVENRLALRQRIVIGAAC